MTLINDHAPLLLRICLVLLFPFSGLDKIFNWDSAMKRHRASSRQRDRTGALINQDQTVTVGVFHRAG
jgi:uncharacterized membrane protein YphA (DoxX/SURF4 family)